MKGAGKTSENQGFRGGNASERPFELPPDSHRGVSLDGNLLVHRIEEADEDNSPTPPIRSKADAPSKSALSRNQYLRQNDDGLRWTESTDLPPKAAYEGRLDTAASMGIKGFKTQIAGIITGGK